MSSFFSAWNHIHVEREMRKLSKKKNDAIHSLMNKQIEDFQLPNFDEFLRTCVKCAQKLLISFQITGNFRN